MYSEKVINDNVITGIVYPDLTNESFSFLLCLNN